MSRGRTGALRALRGGACLASALLLPSCGGAPPPLRHYTLAVRGEAEPRVEGAPALAVAPLVTDSAHDTDRLVYRLSPYRLDYYNYHRWSAAPGLLVADYLRRAYGRTGLFRQVLGEPSADAPWVLGGRIAALEEVDESAERWLAHVALELSLRDARTGAVVWFAAYERREPMTQRNPEGLARALSAALARIVADSAPALAEHARSTPSEPAACTPTGDAQRSAQRQSSTTNGMLAVPSESPLSASVRSTSSRTRSVEAGTRSK